MESTKLLFRISMLFFSVIFLASCLDDNQQEDKVKIVEMTIYPETGYSRAFLSDIWTETLIFSESDDSQLQMLTQIITEDFDFEYERGFEYTFKAEKVWMANPPQDVSSIKYRFIGPLTKKKVITEDREEVLELYISSNTVEFCPRFPYEYNEDGSPQVYDALHVRETNSDSWAVLKEIEGFEFEEGYEYIVSVKKLTHAEPYSTKYILLDIKDKRKKYENK